MDKKSWPHIKDYPFDKCKINSRQASKPGRYIYIYISISKHAHYLIFVGWIGYIVGNLFSNDNSSPLQLIIAYTSRVSFCDRSAWLNCWIILLLLLPHFLPSITAICVLLQESSMIYQLLLISPSGLPGFVQESISQLISSSDLSTGTLLTLFLCKMVCIYPFNSYKNLVFYLLFVESFLKF